MVGAPAFLESGSSLISRAVPGAKPVAARHAQAPAIGDVAASVELDLTAASDAGAVAEERGAPGGDLVATEWKPAGAASNDRPAWLVSRFGVDAVQVKVIVDDKRRFERGALIYPNTAATDPAHAIGVIESEAEPGQPGGLALMNAAALASTDRFIVETLDGPSPARIAPA